MDFRDLVFSQVEGLEALGHDLEGGMGDVTEGVGVEGQVNQAGATIGEKFPRKKS